VGFGVHGFIRKGNSKVDARFECFLVFLQADIYNVIIHAFGLWCCYTSMYIPGQRMTAKGGDSPYMYGY